MWLRHTFSNSIYLEFVAEEENSGAVVTSAAFQTRYHVDYRMVFWSKTF